MDLPAHICIKKKHIQLEEKYNVKYIKIYIIRSIRLESLPKPRKQKEFKEGSFRQLLKPNWNDRLN